MKIYDQQTMKIPYFQKSPITENSQSRISFKRERIPRIISQNVSKIKPRLLLFSLIFASFVFFPTSLKSQDVTTLAGMAGTSGAINGTGTDASFSSPLGVATDAAGNVYVADFGNHLIRKITPAGVVTTLAGMAGTSGAVNGTGTGASFNGPYGVATDAAGNMYVADFGNHLIRKITPAGVVTTLAGMAGTSGAVNGTGTGASFNGPYGVATDAAGNVYVADFGNHLIRKITPAGDVTTLAGMAGTVGAVNGTGTAASFTNPFGVTTDDAGNVYVADRSNALIRKITPTGDVTTLAGMAGTVGAVNANGTAASFNLPYGVATDAARNVYVTDLGNHLIRKITPAAIPIPTMGQWGLILLGLIMLTLGVLGMKKEPLLVENRQN